MRSRILACLPKSQRDWIELRAQAGTWDESNVLLFYALKVFSPGSPDDKDGLLGRVLNPSVCIHAAAAQVELMRWIADVRRMVALGIFLPDLMMSYRAMVSIFDTVFDKAEPQLNLRWNMLKNQLGVPHRIDQRALVAISNFADAELAALVLLGELAITPASHSPTTKRIVMPR